MATAGIWNTSIDRGARWRRTLRFTDADGVAIPVEAPGVMEIRSHLDDDATLIARLDSTGAADGDVTFGPDSNQVVLFLSHTVTADLVPGEYYFDVFVSDSDGERIKLVRGQIEVLGNVSVA